MKLHLINFRCYTDRTFEFDDFLITKIESEPGDGKSTIFEAIYWLMFGNLYEVGNHLAEKKERTIVTLNLHQLPGLGDDIIIRRQNHSNRLTLDIGLSLDGAVNAQHEDTVAQQIINNHFGHKKIWASISYLRQGDQCALLTGSKSERFELLQELSSHNDDPAGCIERIDDKLKEERQSFRDAQTRFQTECSLLQREINTTALPPGLILTVEHQTKLTNNLANWQKELVEETNKEQQRQQLVGSIRQLETQINGMRNQLHNTDSGKLKELEQSTILKLEDERQLLMELEKQLKIKQEEHDKIMNVIQGSLSKKLEELTAKYRNELQQEGQRNQLEASIKHLASTLSEKETALGSMADEQTLMVSLAEKSTAKEQLEIKARELISRISQEEQNYQERLNRIDQEIKVKTDEQTNIRSYLQQIGQQEQMLQTNLTQLTTGCQTNEQHVAQLQVTTDELTKQVEKDQVELSPLPEEGKWPTMMHVGQVSQIETERDKNIKLAQQLNVTYDAELPGLLDKCKNNLQTVRKERDQLLDFKFILENRNALIRNLIRETNDLRQIDLVNVDDGLYAVLQSWRNPDAFTKIEQVVDAENKMTSYVNRYRELIGQRRAAQHVLTCPKCHERVKLVDGKLVVESETGPQTEITMDQLNILVQTLTAILTSMSKMKRIWSTGTFGSQAFDFPQETVEAHGGKPSSPKNDVNLDDIVLDPVPLEVSSPMSEVERQMTHDLSIKEQYIVQMETYIQNLSKIIWIDQPIISSVKLDRLVNLQNNMALLQAKHTELTATQEQLAKVKENLQLHQTQLAQCQTNRSTVEARLHPLSQELTKLQTDRQQITLDSNNAKLVEIKEQHGQVENSIKSINAEIYSGETELRRRKELVSQLSDLRVKVEASRAELSSLPVSNLGLIQAEINRVNSSLEEARGKLQDGELSKLRQDIQLATKQCNDYEMEAHKLKAQIENVAKLEIELVTKDEELTKCRGMLNSLGVNSTVSIQSKIYQTQNELQYVHQGLKMMEWQQRLTTTQSDLAKQQISLAGLEELRQLAERVQYEALEDTINSINNTMSLVFSKVFDDEIRVELKLFREIKSKKRQTPHVNCIIHYKGAKYSRVSLISGGERNRINLGMILALNLVSSSPVVILDECTNFLNNRLRSRCMASVRKLVGGRKTVLVVCHGDNDANYDRVFRLNTGENLDHMYPIVDQ